jgi:hypothetical protein
MGHAAEVASADTLRPAIGETVRIIIAATINKVLSFIPIPVLTRIVGHNTFHEACSRNYIS